MATIGTGNDVTTAVVEVGVEPDEQAPVVFLRQAHPGSNRCHYKEGCDK